MFYTHRLVYSFIFQFMCACFTELVMLKLHELKSGMRMNTIRCNLLPVA